MTRQLLFIALGSSLLTVGICFLSLMPAIQTLSLALATAGVSSSFAEHAFEGLPLMASIDVVLVGSILFLILLFSVGFPLNRAADVVHSIEGAQYEARAPSGPVVARLSSSLRSLSRALATERETNASQLAALRRANEELQRLQADLVGADRLATVGKLAAGVAHEVGNPLAGILGYLSVLRSQGSMGHDLLQRIEDEVQRIDSIVRSLLELGRPSRGGAEPFDARVAVDAVCQLLRASSDFQEVKLSIRGPLSMWVRGEPGPFSQVVVNLLLNAAQAAAGRGEVVVTLDPGSPCRVMVDDSGPGIAGEVMPRLFDLFFTTKPAGRGTGLGLAISRHLLSQFGAQLSAQNRAEGGARFVVTLLAL